MEKYAFVKSCRRTFADETLDIDLTSLIPNLDSAASDLVAHQRDALVQRKDLAQKTKDFRKLDDTVKLGEVKGLLKCL
jgi:homeobox protein cut-like